MQHNPLLSTLRLIERLVDGPMSCAALAALFGLAPVSVKRHVGEARVLGADIAAIRRGAGWVYELRNPDHVIERTRRWIELETARDVREADKLVTGAK